VISARLDAQLESTKVLRAVLPPTACALRVVLMTAPPATTSPLRVVHRVTARATSATFVAQMKLKWCHAHQQATVFVSHAKKTAALVSLNRKRARQLCSAFVRLAQASVTMILSSRRRAQLVPTVCAQRAPPIVLITHT